MTVINITGCRMFEDEIIDTLCNDPGIDEIMVFQNDECAGIVEKLVKAGLPHRVMSVDKIKRAYRSVSMDSYVVTINIMGLELHGDPRSLKDQVYENVKHISYFSDGIFLFYGLCGNVLKKIEKDLEQLTCPVSILKDNDGKIVDDCIGAVIGGRKSFLKMTASFNRKSALVMTPMWARNWKEMFKHCGFIENTDDIDMAKFVLDSMGYETVVTINTGTSYTEGAQEEMEKFADLFRLNILEVQGNRDLIKDSYADFREMVMSHHSISRVAIGASQGILSEQQATIVPETIRTS
ncbi:MAG: DUF1638 domain-containing protein [Methanolobus sp.]|nr:DUF1638 domain-containing protein [Methanolobus sp.]